MVEAAPAVVFWAGDESSCDWISVDVLDLLNEFAGGEGVEVVIAGLPELLARAFQELGRLSFEDS